MVKTNPRLSLPIAPYARTVLEPVRIWQRPIASGNLKPSLQIDPHRPAKNIVTLPAVRELDDIVSYFDTNLTTEEPVNFNC